MLTIILLLLTTLLTVIVFEKKFGECLPVTIMVNVFIVFLTGFINFKIGYFIILIEALVSIVLIARMILQKDKDKINKIIKNYFTIGLFLTVVAFCLLVIISINKSFTRWDNFSHWGVMVKELLRLDTFYSIDASTLMAHKDYPPFISILEAISCHFQGYSESAVIITLEFFSFSLFVPFVENANNNKLSKFIKTFILFALILFTCLQTINGSLFFETYLDGLLAFLIAYTFVVITIDYSITYFNILKVGIALLMLIMTKQIALVFVLMCLVYFGLLQILKYKKSIISIEKYKQYFSNRKNTIKILTLVLVVIVMPLAITVIWNSYISSLNISPLYSGHFVISDIKLGQVFGIIRNTAGEQWQHITYRNFIQALTTTTIMTFNGIRLSYISSCFLGLSAVAIAFVYSKDYIKEYVKSAALIILIIGVVGYCFVMLLSYMFCFGSYEGPILASYSRYMSTMIQTLIAIGVMVFIYANARKTSLKKSYCIDVFVISLLLGNTADVGALKEIPESLAYHTEKAIDTYKDEAEIILNNTNENSKIYIVDCGGDLKAEFYIHYLTSPRFTNKQNYDCLDPSAYKNSINKKEVTVKELTEYLEDFDYVYVHSLKDYYSLSYNGLVKNGGLEVGKLYKIEKENGALVLVKHRKKGALDEK